MRQNCYFSHWSLNWQPLKARVEWIGKEKSNSRAKVGMSTALGTLFKEHSSKIRIVISFLQAAQWLSADIFFESNIVYEIVLILEVYRSTLKITAIILKTQAFLLSMEENKITLLLGNLARLSPSVQGFVASAIVSSLNSLTSKVPAWPLGNTPSMSRIFFSENEWPVSQERKTGKCHRLTCETLCVLLIGDYWHAHPSLELQVTAGLAPFGNNSQS